MNRYEVFYKDNIIGTACVSQIGLYTQFECQCAFSKDALYRIVAKHKKGQIDLGICIRSGDTYIIKSKIPTKYITLDDLKFCALAESQKDDTVFVPVESNVPFDHFADIMNAKFSIREGRKGVLIRKD